MIYSGENLKEINFPLGGIGSGSIGLTGNGNLMDWEIFNRPSKGSHNGYSQLCVRTVSQSGKLVAKTLMGDIQKDLTGQYCSGVFSGYGYGPFINRMGGFSHFEKCLFDGRFPMAEITFGSESFPGEVRLRAFNPLIPHDSLNSSIPAAFFEVEYTNTSDEAQDFSVAFPVQNPFEVSVNTDVSSDGISAVMMKNAGVDEESVDYGDITIATDSENVSIQPYWYRGEWQDRIVTFWNEFKSTEDLRYRQYDCAGKNDHCAIMANVRAQTGETCTVRFVISWNVPNCYNYWNPLKDESGNHVSWKNYYATVFENSVSSAVYSLKNWDELYSKTKLFTEVLHGSTLDPAIIDAAASTLSVIKTATVLRLEDGSFYGWEGCMEQTGSCEGTCEHVWNYAYALCFLFPELERSIRDYEFEYQTLDTGYMVFRTALPIGRTDYNRFHPCVDGQMGSVIKAYREWKISGNTDWLRSIWGKVKLALEFAWSAENEYEWDADRDGVMEGRQHHTLDMELFGPSSWLQSFYIAALDAASRMAEALGETETASEYRNLHAKAYEWTKNNLFNNEYFIHKIDITDESITNHFDCNEKYWNSETGEIKYQISGGSSIDQMCGQWHAVICGLDDVFDKKQRLTALKSMMKYNFKESMRSFDNPWRIFALNDESGTVICDYPIGVVKPKIPVPYCEETMHGFEYEFAGLLASEGMTDECIRIVKAVRNRYNGSNRNPWNEIECGNNYARSMASYALIPILSGFSFDMTKGYIGFSPKVNRDSFKCIYSIADSWGEVEITGDDMTLTVYGNGLELSSVGTPEFENVRRVTIDGKDISFDFTCGKVSFEKTNILKELKIHV